MFSPRTPDLSRRRVLGGVLAASAAVVAAPLLTSSPAGAYGLPTSPVDVSHADAEVARLVGAYFHNKNAAEPDATMAHFSRNPFAYLDATLGLSFATWQSLLDFFRQVMPTWTDKVRSYPVRILGDATSAVVFFVESAGAFGPAEIRAAAAVNFRHGLITRNVDYWDGRHFGLQNLAGAQTPQNKFPADWRESIAGETASPVIQVAGFLTRAGADLPYAASGVSVRHVVGSARGGGFEWKGTGAVPRGLTALELGPDARITRLTAIWDGSLADDAHLAHLQAATIEH